MNYVQKGSIRSDVHIKQAPVVRLRGQINVPCENGQTQPLKCCVQSGYEVRWYEGLVILPSGKNEPSLDMFVRD